MTTATPLQTPTDSATDFQQLRFQILQRLLKVQTVTLVQVVAIYGGGVAPVGTLDVLPLVDQIDGAGTAQPHVTLYNRPYLRVQGGTLGIVCDPQVGDIGVMVFAARDISAVLSSRGHGPPPSRRVFDYADGLYLFSIPNETPTSFIQFDPTTGDIDIVATGRVRIQGTTVNMNGAVVSSSGEVTDSAGIVLGTHVHEAGEYTTSEGPVTGLSGEPES